MALTEEPQQDLAREYGVRATMIGVKPDGQRLADIGKFIDDGKLHPLIHAVLRKRSTIHIMQAVIVSARHSPTSDEQSSWRAVQHHRGTSANRSGAT